MLCGAVQGQDLGRCRGRSFAPQTGLAPLTPRARPTEAHGLLRCSACTHLGRDEVLKPAQQPGVPSEVHSVAVFQPGPQEAETSLVDLGEGRAGVLVGPAGRGQET